MNEPHVRNGLYLGLSIILVTLFSYFISIEFMLMARPYIVLGLYIYWMRRSVKETTDLLPTVGYYKILMRNAWLTFMLGMAIGLGFMHLFANYGDPSIIDITRAISQKSYEMLGEMFNQSEDQMETLKNQPTTTNPYSLRAYAALFPAYLVVPGALLAFIISRVVKPSLPPTPKA